MNSLNINHILMQTAETKKIERSNSNKVFRSFTRMVKPLGFRRVKTRQFWIREQKHVIEFIHIHKFTFGPKYRIHICIRVINSPLDFLALQGVTDKELDKGATFQFEDSATSVSQCSEDMFNFIKQSAEGWFLKYRDIDRLLSSGSPIFNSECSQALVDALKNGPDESRVQKTRQLFDL